MNPHEELLSAYLDGELSPDEKASAEALLASNPEARRFYDELVALRSAIKALPRREVSPELVRRVIERTEQELAKEKTTGAETQIADRRVELPPSTDVEPAPWRPLRTWRAIFWPLAALAAAIFVMVYQENPPGKELAKHVPPAADAAADRKASGEGRFGRGDFDGEIRHNGDLWSKDPDRETAAAPKSKAFGASSNDFSVPLHDASTLGDSTVDLGQLAEQSWFTNVASVKTQLENGETPQGLVVINCTVTPQAAKEATLEKVLADNKISVDTTPDESREAGGRRGSGQEKGGSPQAFSYARSAKLPEPVGQEVEAYYVEVPYDQLQATVAEFNRRSDEIRAVEVESNPSTPPALMSMNRGGAVDLGGAASGSDPAGSLDEVRSPSFAGEKTEEGAPSAPASSAFDVESESDSVPAAKAPAKAEGEERQERMRSYAKKGVPTDSEADKEKSNRPAPESDSKGQLQQAPRPERQSSLSPRQLKELKQNESALGKQAGRQDELGIENPSRAARFKYNALPPVTRGREQLGGTLFTDPSNDLQKQLEPQGGAAANESRRGVAAGNQRFDKPGGAGEFYGQTDGAAPAQTPPVAQPPADGRQVASSPPLRVLIRQFVVSADEANKADAAKSKAANQAPGQQSAPAVQAKPAAPQKAINDAPQPRPAK